ncbi:uncharacterized protein BT62DRAFT_932282 [Guyanagaster necrorhizus]|uniref:Uncharacterized protein n=1 Tax=Guyanagaster necrorhizus TaxID=856835 RepID=A0A9P7VSQ6_9AGAR|nr:uncharacterized protein BT62DRAFT_932282 [Guyanagaster necrorhizus MCA 3950]KAG7445943.1 hypothetical protein BT62DRAFT_932282 [Guyanagaster necrorhizus MCA 3950]
MSFTVEDLVSSFSSSHIGQEAMDLAALQAQLAQALFVQDMPRENHCRRPCSTPTLRTPSSSFSWGPAIGQSSSRRQTDEVMRDSDELEDERMVEDLLLPEPPISVAHFAVPSQSRPQHKSQKSTGTGFTAISSESNFTTTDPFYMAQLQAMQYNSPPPSVFSQLGRPAQQSPFVQPQQPYPLPSHRDGFLGSPSASSISIDPSSYLVTSSPFEC